jgi:hypothetical protein
MAARKQVSVTMENTPGTLARMCSAFAERKVNILAFTSSEREGKSLVRLIVDKLKVAKKALEGIGYSHTEEQVLGTKLPNRPGMLGTVAKKLADAGINIEYAYSGVEPGPAQQLVVLSVSDFDRAKKLVK